MRKTHFDFKQKHKKEALIWSFVVRIISTGLVGASISLWLLFGIREVEDEIAKGRTRHNSIYLWFYENQAFIAYIFLSIILFGVLLLIYQNSKKTHVIRLEEEEKQFILFLVNKFSSYEKIYSVPKKDFAIRVRKYKDNRSVDKIFFFDKSSIIAELEKGSIFWTNKRKKVDDVLTPLQKYRAD